jgi:hypothetical protein
MDGLVFHYKKNILDALIKTRSIKPYPNNWILFSAIIETFFFMVGENFKYRRIIYSLTQFDQWYLGDGFYGDGADFHLDYYNSYVIHPCMLDIVKTFEATSTELNLFGTLKKYVDSNTKCNTV